MTTTSVIRVCGVSLDASFHDGLNKTIGGCVRLRGPEISPFGFEVVLQPQGPLIRVCGVSNTIDASFHGGYNDTIGGRLRPRRPETLLSYCQHCQKFISGLIDTSDKIVTTVLSPVSLTPAKNLSAVSLTLVIKLFPRYR